jgi:hypothetical protein
MLISKGRYFGQYYGKITQTTLINPKLDELFLKQMRVTSERHKEIESETTPI